MKMSDYETWTDEVWKWRDEQRAEWITDEMVYASTGFAGEAGEVLDCFKKCFKGKYDQPNGQAHLVEEMGDALYYLARMAKCLNLSLEDVLEINRDKLNKRHGNKIDKN